MVLDLLRRSTQQYYEWAQPQRLREETSGGKEEAISTSSAIFLLLIAGKSGAGSTCIFAWKHVEVLEKEHELVWVLFYYQIFSRVTSATPLSHWLLASILQQVQGASGKDQESRMKMTRINKSEYYKVWVPVCMMASVLVHRGLLVWSASPQYCFSSTIHALEKWNPPWEPPWRAGSGYAR